MFIINKIFTLTTRLLLYFQCLKGGLQCGSYSTWNLMVDRVDRAAPSLMMKPRIQQLTKKKPSEANQRPGKKVLMPRNSSW